MNSEFVSPDKLLPLCWSDVNVTKVVAVVVAG